MNNTSSDQQSETEEPIETGTSWAYKTVGLVVLLFGSIYIPRP